MSPIRTPRASPRFNPLPNNQTAHANGPKSAKPPDDGFWTLPLDPRPAPLSLCDLECLRMLGQGVHGSVLLVRVRRNKSRHSMDKPGSLFAVKIFNKKSVRQTDWNDKHFKNFERKTLAALPWDPFVCGLVDVFYDTKSLYLLLELVTSGTLLTAIRKRGPFDAATAAFYFANIVCGLEHLHFHGIIHRDLKPENILMGPDGYLCIADFGSSINQYTREEDFFAAGTPAYMAPELFSPQTITPVAIDWWAAGCILFEMVCRKLTFLGKTNTAIYERVKSGIYNWPPNIKVGKKLQDIVAALLNMDHKERLGSIDDAVAVQNHPWLYHIQWDKMHNRQYLAPFVPDEVNLTEVWHTKPLPRNRAIPDLRMVNPPLHQIFDDRFRFAPPF